MIRVPDDPVGPVPKDDPAGEGLYPPLGERRAYAAPYERLTFSLVTRGGRELSITLAAQARVRSRSLHSGEPPHPSHGAAPRR